MIPFIILAIEDDDDRAFMEDIYKDFRLLMLSEIWGLIDNRWTVEDLVQDTIENLIKRLDILRTLDRKRLTSYIAAAARNIARNYLRSKKRSPVIFVDELEATDWSLDNNVENMVIDSILLEQLSELWPSLPENTRELLERKYILFQDDKEIAEAFGIRAGSVRMKLTRARKAVYELLNNTKTFPS